MAGRAQSDDELKQFLIDALGSSTWDKSWESIAHYSPELYKASVNLSAVPVRKKHLDAKTQSLVSLAVDSASTHLYVPGIRQHTLAALKAGASVQEVVEVIELTSTLGIHACNIGVPILVEVMKEEGLYEKHATASKPLDERREKLKADFTKNRGYWHEFWEDFLKLDPEFFESYLEFSSVPWLKDVKGDGRGGGALSPKMKELIYCAFDVAATHLYQPGLKLHIRNALTKYGATPEEVTEVMELATLLSTHTAHVALPILAECERAA